MLRGKGIMRWGLIGLAALGLTLSACAGGVSQKDFDAMKQQLSAKEQEAASLKQQAEAAKAVGQSAAALQQQLTAKEQEAATLKKQAEETAAAAKRAVWQIIPDAPPRPTPAPLPPGVTPPPPPTPPAARTVPLFFYVDTVTAAPGESKYKVDASLGCLRTSVFKRGQRIVWRMEVVDTSTGKIQQAADVATAILKLPHGENLNLAFGRHGGTATSPWFWAVGWDIPPDYPLGYINYTIEVTTKGGKAGIFKEMVLETAVAQQLTEARKGGPVTTAGLMIIE